MSTRKRVKRVVYLSHRQRERRRMAIAKDVANGMELPNVAQKYGLSIDYVRAICRERISDD